MESSKILSPKPRHAICERDDMTVQYVKHEKVFLSDLSVNENWLEELIQNDPSILGLGALEVLDRQRRNPGSGRLDLLLADPSGSPRYEVELMLGTTDPDHIMRCIEYWDIERRRYPAYDHVAVLVAEDITWRFINILSLFAGSIPMIILQLNALKLGDKIILDFIKVIDQKALRRDDETTTDTAITVDRNYWIEYAGEDIMKTIDKVLEFINEKAEPTQMLNYRKAHIGLTNGTKAGNFIWFEPRTKFTYIGFVVSNKDEWQNKFEEAGFSTNTTPRSVSVSVNPAKFKENENLFREIVHQAAKEFQE